ncbi:MAG: hypothetical protein WCO57_08640 [Verrucomicrobiota bacterium]
MLPTSLGWTALATGTLPPPEQVVDDSHAGCLDVEIWSPYLILGGE